MKLLLHGGDLEADSERNQQFYREVLRLTDKQLPRILCIYFARPGHRWSESFAIDSRNFQNVAAELGVAINLTLASYEDDLVELIHQSDAVFISGGRKGRLKESLLSVGVDELKLALEDKVLAGVSAGANMLGHYYYSSVAKGIRRGIGLIDYKIFTHFQPDCEGEIDELKNDGADFPVLRFAERDWTVLAASSSSITRAIEER